ncbi:MULTISPECIES: hypothetical protein [Pseudoalteromonas]|uniref:hypothetical protein n=1 Tax=Pseudoalteromonas TaxID=53246 RepID=UPI001582438E|nr:MULTISPECIES: hypothetical protein [Pseudoalteromonas]MDI4653809.1 hypothetical protein [Pseudoalteromonas shioyasakiensis]NUJ40019.1 hypothetical protein [Pseudoalteromonas sp. 0303]
MAITSINSIAKNQFNPENLNNAVRMICATYGVSDYQVHDALRDVYEYGLDRSSCSAQRIIYLWEDHCADQFAYDCEEYGFAA